MNAAQLARCLTVPAAAIALAWSVAVYPIFLREVPVVNAATRIIAGEHYKPETLSDLVGAFATNDTVRPLEKLAVIRLRQVEDAVTADAAARPELVDLALEASNRALAKSPVDSFQWLARLWLSNEKNGKQPEHLALLQMSYLTAPYEGWIAKVRLQMALPLYSILTDDLRAAALADFAGLVRSEMYSEAAEVAARTDRLLRYVLFASLSAVPIQRRRIFATMLAQRDLDDAPIPGIERRPSRPWRINRFIDDTHPQESHGAYNAVKSQSLRSNNSGGLCDTGLT